MADKKISQLTAATLPLAGTEVLPLVQTSTKKVAVADLLGGVTVSSGFSASIAGGGTVYLGAANSYGDLALLKNAAGVTKIGVSNDDGTASSGATFSSYYGGTEIGAFGHYWNGGEFINRIKYFSKQEFAEGTTVRVRIEQTSGDLTAVTGNFVVGIAGKGIDFSANGGDVLSQYDEGTWSPTIFDAISGGNQGSSTGSSGVYTRVGNMVTVHAVVVVASTAGMTAGNIFFIGGLPFAAKNVPNVDYHGVSDSRSITTTSGGVVGTWLQAGESRLRLFTTTAAGNLNNVTVADVASGSAYVFLSLTYLAA